MHAHPHLDLVYVYGLGLIKTPGKVETVCWYPINPTKLKFLVAPSICIILFHDIVVVAGSAAEIVKNCF